MRQRNWRLIIVGGVLDVLAAGFFFVMLGMAAKSNDPKTLMQTVGQVCGVVGTIGMVMLIAGVIGKKTG